MTEWDFLQGNIAIVCNEALGKDWFIIKLIADERRTDCGTNGHYINRFVCTHDLTKYETKIARKLIQNGIFRKKIETSYGFIYENGISLREKHQKLMNILNKNLIKKVKERQIKEVLNGDK
jgi:hypothetical protein